MSDYDRGAYAPPSDSPLAFDARAPRDRRPAPVSLIVGLLVLALLGGGLLFMYRGGVREAGGAPAVVGEPVGVIRTAPDGEQPRDPALQLEVYDERDPLGTAPAAAGPTFAPDPELPLVRGEGAPAAPAPAPTPAPTLPSPTEREASAPIAPVPSAPAPRPAPSAAPARAPAPAPQPTPVPAERRAETPAPARAERPATSASASGRASTSASGSASAVRPRETTPSARTAAATPERPRSGSASASAARREPATPTIASVLDDAARTDARTRRTEERAAARAAQAAAPAARAPATSGGGRVSVQIGAFSSQEAARRELARAGGPGSRVEPVTTGEGTLYRGLVTGFADREAAQAYCGRLRASGQTCIVR